MGNVIKLVGDIIIVEGNLVCLVPHPLPPFIIKPTSLACLMHKSHSTVLWSYDHVTICMSGKQLMDKERDKHSHFGGHKPIRM